MPQTQMQAKTGKLEIDVVGSSTFGRYGKISSAVTYNMFISDNFLVNFAGYKKVVDILSADGPVTGRGAFSSSRLTIAVVVVNSAVYVLDSLLSPTFVGNLSSSFGSVSMDENLAGQICIVDGLNAYIYNHSIGSLTKQTLNSNLIPNYVCYHNSFFLFGNGAETAEGSKFFVYQFASDTTISEVAELSLQTKPDFALAVKRLPSSSNNVLVFGKSVCEIWTQVPGIQVYQRNSSISVDYGCLSTSTIAASDVNVFWLGVNESNAPVIMQFTGAGAKAISTDGIDHLLGNIKYPQQSTAFFYREDGHLFYQLTFYNQSDNLTLLYDVDTGRFFNLSDYKGDYHPARDVIYFNNKVYFVSLNNGSMYEMSTNYVTYDENIGNGGDDDFDREIPRARVCTATRSPDASSFRVNSFSLMIDQGNDPRFQALSLDQTSFTKYITSESGDFVLSELGDFVVEEGKLNNIPYIPRVDLSFSRDAGRTWSNYLEQQMKPLAYRQNMMRWQRPMGLTNDFTLKLRFWGKCYYCVGNGYIEIY